MSKNQKPRLHRFIVATCALAAFGGGACSWDVSYLDSGGNDPPSNMHLVDASGSTADAGGGNSSMNKDSSTSSTSSTSSSSSTGTSSSSSSGTPNFGDGGNLIQNPSCENGIAPWSTLGGSPVAPSTAFVCPGNTASCYSSDRTHEENSPMLPSYDGPMQDVSNVVVPGHNYTASAWAFWAPPGYMPPTDADAAADASSDGSAGDAGSRDAATDAEVDANFEAQSVYITAKVTCGSAAVAYNRIAEATNVPEATWTVVPQSTLLMVPSNCGSAFDIQLYVEGPDVGLDLYVDEVSLTFVN